MRFSVQGLIPCSRSWFGILHTKKANHTASSVCLVDFIQRHFHQAVSPPPSSCVPQPDRSGSFGLPLLLKKRRYHFLVGRKTDKQYKELDFISREAMADWLAYGRRILEHAGLCPAASSWDFSVTDEWVVWGYPHGAAIKIFLRLNELGPATKPHQESLSVLQTKM